MADEEPEQTIETERRLPTGRYETVVQPVLAEFLGVCFYVFISLMAVPYGLNAEPLVEGLSIALLMIALGHLSGGHFNPAVTVGMAISGGVRVILAVSYVVAQIIGAMLGAALARAVLQNNNFRKIQGGTYYPPPPTPLEPLYVGWRIFGEGLLTFLWVFTFLMTTINNNGVDKKLAPFAVGFMVFVGRQVSVTTTQGYMNPVRSFGPAVAASGLSDGSGHTLDPWKEQYVYWVGPLAGSLVAAVLYKLFYASRNRRWLFKGGRDQFLMP